MNKEDNKKKLTLKEKWNDKRERAKLELLLYGIFFLILIIFLRIGNSTSNNGEINSSNDLFISNISDNYQYDIRININDNIYEYTGKVLGYNASISKIIDNDTEYFYKKKDMYYKLDINNGYILTNKNEIYNVIDYDYIDINNIKEYIKLSSLEDNLYKVKVSDIILNSDSNDYITINVDNINNSIEIDYTNLFKINDNSTTKTIINITYSNINKIISLEE